MASLWLPASCRIVDYGASAKRGKQSVTIKIEVGEATDLGYLIREISDAEKALEADARKAGMRVISPDPYRPQPKSKAESEIAKLARAPRPLLLTDQRGDAS